MKLLNTLICFLLLASLSLGSKLTIISPHYLADKFEDNEVEFALSHFGNIPFGSHFIGRVVETIPDDGCSSIEPFTEGEEAEYENPVAIVRRGGCRVAIKSRNAQFAGAKALIIVSTEDEKDLSGSWFGHEQGADDIKIPTLLISKSDGDKILDTLQEQTKKGNYDGIVIGISFTHAKSNVVNLDYWYSAADSFRTSFIFLQHFKEYWTRNNRVMTFVPHVITWTCSECKKQNFKTADNKDCLSGGRYCSPDPDDSGPLTGADVVREDLRQMCVFSASQPLWWDYAVAVGEECLEEGDFKNCGDRILKGLASSSQVRFVEECIAKSFEVEDSSRSYNDELDDNTILREHKKNQVEYAINQFPVLFINQKPYYGRLNRANQVFQEACRNMDPYPEDCNVALSRTGEATYTTSESHTGRIIVLVIVMLVVALFFFYYCRRMMKRENRDMSLEVGSMVNRYFSIKESA